MVSTVKTENRTDNLLGIFDLVVGGDYDQFLFHLFPLRY